MAMPSHIWINGLWERINDELRKQNRTKKDVAEQCGFDQKTLHGHYNISIPNLAKLCKELNVSVDYILFGKKHEQTEGTGYG